MRYIIILLSLITISGSLSGENKLFNNGQLKGDISPLGINCDELVIINAHQQISSGPFSDTVKVKNGKFEFNYHVGESKHAVILLLYKKKTIGQLTFINKLTKRTLHFVDRFYLDNSSTIISMQKKIQIPGPNGIPSFAVNITGSPETDLYFYTTSLDHENRSITKELVERNKNSYFLLQKIYEDNMEYNSASLEDLSAYFSEKVKKSGTYRKLKANLERTRKLNLYGFKGGFPLVDTLNRSYSFDKVSQGKPILLIYWASWCQPCRAEIPQLKEFYKLHNNKIRMVSLSIDTDYKNWKTAVLQEKMPWVNLSGLPKTPSKISDYYGIKTIPTMILLSSTGKQIIKVNNNLEEIEKVVAAL